MATIPLEDIPRTESRRDTARTSGEGQASNLISSFNDKLPLLTIHTAPGSGNQVHQPGNDPDGPDPENPPFDLNSPRMLPPQRAEVNSKRGFFLSHALCCLSFQHFVEGSAVDCQRAIDAETLGLTVSLKWLASAGYYVRNKRLTGLRYTTREMEYTTPFIGPHIKVMHNRDTSEMDPYHGRERLDTWTDIEYGARLPAGGPFIKAEHTKKKSFVGTETYSSSQTRVEYGTRIYGASYAVSNESERINGHLTKSEKTTTVTANKAEPGSYSQTTRNNLLPAVAEAGNDPLGESHDSVAEAVEPAPEANDSIRSSQSRASSIPSIHDEIPPSPYDNRYILIGIFNKKTGLARETVTTRLQRPTHKTTNHLFTSIRTLSWTLWPLHKRLFSLKSISGFSLYHCHVDSGYHSPVEIDDRTKQTLLEFYLDYTHEAPGMDERWMEWVHGYLNSGSADPRVGSYTLELLLRWSITKILVYGLLPVVGSLVAGVAYMQVRMRDAGDFGEGLAVVQTAWGIASYVVGAAGGKLPPGSAVLK